MQNETDPRYSNGPVVSGGVPFLSTQANSLSNTITDALNTGGIDTAVASSPSSATRLSTAISNYTFLAQQCNVSGTANAIVLGANQIVVPGNSYGQPFRLPSVMATGMTFSFYAAFANTTNVTVQITGLQTAIPLLKTSVTSGVISYVALSANDLIVGQYTTIIYNATADSGSPAFILKTINSGVNLPGIISLATTSDVTTATDNTKAISPLALAGLYSASTLSTAGDISIPVLASGVFQNFIIKWGLTVSVGGGSPITTIFPAAFPTDCIFASVIGTVYTGSPESNNTVTSISAASFSCTCGSNTVQQYRWFAIGY